MEKNPEERSDNGKDVDMKRIFVGGSVLLLVLFALVEFARPRMSGRIVG